MKINAESKKYQRIRYTLVVGYDITTLDKDLFTANETGNHKNNLNILYTLPFPTPRMSQMK